MQHGKKLRDTLPPWTRRQTLTALAGIPLLTGGGLHADQPVPLPAELEEICRRAVAAPPQARLGQAAAMGRALPQIAAALCARLTPHLSEGWTAALVARGQRDMSEGDLIEVLGLPLMRTEAEVLALGAYLAPPLPAKA